MGMNDDIIKGYIKDVIDMASDNIRKGLGGPFAAIIIDESGEVIAKGANSVTSTNDPTAHAEIVAIRDACKKLKTFSLEKTIIISSCEPCPMCLSAIYWADIDKLFYAADKNDAAEAGFDDAFIYKEIKLSPQKRRLSSKKIKYARSFDPFREWIEMEGKIEY